MQIRIILGAPCAGKTAYISEHAAPSDITLDWDRLAAALTPSGNLGKHAARPDAQRRLATYARAALGAHIRDTWPGKPDYDDLTVWIPITSLEAFAGGLDKYITAGARLTVLDTPREECLRRAETDHRPESTIDAINAYYDNPPEIPQGWLYSDPETSEIDTMKAKTTDIHLKAFGGERTATLYPEWALKEGDFAAYASTFNDEPDAVGDIVAPGAFTETLNEWKAKGTPIPLLFGHRMDDPAYNIGYIVDAKEDEHGLLVWGRLDLDTPKGRDCHRLLKSRRLTQLSFAYDIKDAHKLPPHEGDGLMLKALDLHEVSLVPLGANRHTSVLAVKAAVDAVASTMGAFTKDERDTLKESISDFSAALDKLESLIKDPTPDGEETPSATDTPPETSLNPEEENTESEAATAPPAETETPTGNGGLSDADKAAAQLALSLALSNA